jgi:hypothetical protein|tara:strand:+ start:91 stop:642 length:552 start_codon:yes stop_codon:yes gene_type:complete
LILSTLLDSMDYKIHKSQTVIDHQLLMINDLDIAQAHVKEHLPVTDLTWNYRYYNIFAVTSPSPTFFNLFKEVCSIIREHVGDDRPLWMQSWLNRHLHNEVLDWHGHDYPWHGYVCIDPKDSTTLFEGYDINNEVGNIYIGPGHRRHKVESLSAFEGHRLTLGFDVHDETGTPYDQFGMVPVL